VISTYTSLILVPAGPNTVRRVGFFEKLPKDEVKESVDEEITILQRKHSRALNESRKPCFQRREV
jgi:hypothetical protein